MPEIAQTKSTVSLAQPRQAWRTPTFTRELGLAALTLFIVLLFSILYPYTFRSFDNFNAILRNLAFEGILATGMMIMLVGGVFDLSVGAMASLIGVITGWLMKNAGWPVPAAVAAGLAVAAAGGFLNGFIVAKVRVNALITTLGTMGIFQGAALLIRSEEHTSELQSLAYLVCRLLLE